MNRRSSAAIFAGAFVLAGAAAAFAATQEYDITVPVTLKGTAERTAGITISCAVGRPGLAYSTASGGATGATGSGSTHASIGVRDALGKLLPPVDVVVVVAEQATGSTGLGADATGAAQYLCWGKLDKGTTPVNFISGALK
jgi:hypothetical protein